jgi:hypothetical protein
MACDEQDFDLIRDIKFHQAQLKLRYIEIIKLVAKIKVSLSYFYQIAMRFNALDRVADTI